LLLPGLLLAFMLVLAGGAALRESAAVDEVAHIGAAISYWQRLDLRLNGEHPPLPKLIAGLPLALRRVQADYSSPPWALAYDRHMAQWVFGEWILNRWNRPEAVLFWSRMPMLALTLVLGWCVFAIGRRLGGDWGGLLSLTAYATSSTFLAFGPFVVTDVAVAMFSLLSLWTFANLWHTPSRRNVALFGAAFAGAVLSKFTSGILLFAFLAFALVEFWKPVAPEPRGGRLRAVVRGLLLAGVLVYAVYFVFSWNQPTTDLEGFGTNFAAMAVRRLLMPVWLVVRGLFALLSGASRPTFLLGTTYPRGVWFYFPVCFALKAAPGFLGLLAMTGALYLWRRNPSSHPLHWRVLAAGFAVYTSFCLLTRVNIGLRHFMVPMILMMVAISALPRLLGSSRAGAAIAGLCALSCVLSALAAYPYYVPYTNVLAFGKPAWQLMGDSNIDWHQALPDVRTFVERNHIENLLLDDYGLSDPAAVVPQAVAWNCAQPSAEDAGKWAVVSANMFLDYRRCTWLTNSPVEALGGGSMYAVRLPSIPPQAVPPVLGPRMARALYREAVRNPSRTAEILEQLEASVNPETGK
jgi:hypothetical protein